MAIFGHHAACTTDCTLHRYTKTSNAHGLLTSVTEITFANDTHTYKKPLHEVATASTAIKLFCGTPILAVGLFSLDLEDGRRTPEKKTGSHI